ncbi:MULTISPECIES: YdcF family protein [unclassified Legionella]|uniref:YdcF family protein n=1 Tax=unclassified Legionella TaxID=2622702 RepID=UPI0010565379|nr:MULTISPECIES: ElyC/SanA/YdcF family protein [unclassified Legionella]MDI9818088.1 ElyC/SanA/YdcF family protein [Legionella sp. PL877]
MAGFRQFLEFFLNPFNLNLLLLALCLICLWVYGNSRLVRWGLLSVLVLFLLLSTGWLPQLLTRQLEDQYSIVLKADPAVHWVVVLSGGQSEVEDNPANSLLYSASIKRLLEGIRLYRQLPAAKLVLSGGGYGFQTPEALRLADIASWFPIPAADVVLETQSINTADQAKAVKNTVKEAPFYLVTSAIHMPRSMALFQAQGMHPIAAPTDYTYYWNDERWAKRYLPNPYNLLYLSIAMHELLGRLWAKMHNNYQAQALYTKI